MLKDKAVIAKERVLCDQLIHGLAQRVLLGVISANQIVIFLQGLHKSRADLRIAMGQPRQSLQMLSPAKCNRLFDRFEVFSDIMLPLQKPVIFPHDAAFPPA